MDVPEHSQVMEYLRFFGPVLSTVVILALVYGFKLWKDHKKKPQTLEGAAAETQGDMTGRDAFNLLMDLRHQAQNLGQNHAVMGKDHEHFEKTLDKLAEVVEKDHDLLIELKARFDASK